MHKLAHDTCTHTLKLKDSGFELIILSTFLHTVFPLLIVQNLKIDLKEYQSIFTLRKVIHSKLLCVCVGGGGVGTGEY